jgi:cytosine/adenosine deaminase-related metal-dependent hydrolase
MKNTLLLPTWLIQNTQELPRSNWGVRIVDGKIAAVGFNQELRQRFPADEVVEAPSEILAPGFVNAHTHMYGVLAHGIPLDRAPSGLWPFLKDFWWPLVEDQLDHEMICAATDLRCINMIRSGVTSFYDCTEAPHALPGILHAQAEIVRERGIRGVLSFEATQRVSQENGLLGLEENANFIDATRGSGGLVSGLLCFHTTFTCSSDFILQVFEHAQEKDTLVHMHCAEGTYEPEFTLGKYGKRTLHYYDDLGVLGSRMLASQCVQIDSSEVEIMGEKGVRMVHMPLSNCEVGGGIAPVPELIGAGVTVGLGSDGYVDDFFEVMRGAFLIHKASHLDPQVMSAQLVWRLATEGGAAALGLEKVGRLEVGWEADLQLINCDLPTPLKAHNLYEQMLLYRNHNDVRATMVAGKWLLQDGAHPGLDIEDIAARTRRAAARMWANTTNKEG